MTVKHIRKAAKDIAFEIGTYFICCLSLLRSLYYACTLDNPLWFYFLSVLYFVLLLRIGYLAMKLRRLAILKSKIGEAGIMKAKDQKKQYFKNVGLKRCFM